MPCPGVLWKQQRARPHSRRAAVHTALEADGAFARESAILSQVNELDGVIRSTARDCASSHWRNKLLRSRPAVPAHCPATM